MHTIAAVAVAAYVACAFSVSAARADDCDPDEVADIAKCARGLKVPGIRQLIPPSVRRPADVVEACDPDEVADVAKCLRDARLPSVRRPAPEVEDEPVQPEAKKAAGNSDTPRKAPIAKAETGPPATIASSEKPATVGGRNEAPLCQKYLPSIGQLVSVPCGE